LTGSSAVGRIVAVLAIAVAAIVVVMLFTGGEDEYEVTAEFANASQLVPGNQVMVGGLSAGSVKKIELGDDGQALVTFTVDEEFAPLTTGATATVRSGSLSSIAGRQIQLTLPPSTDAGEPIEDGQTMDQSQTVSEVDLDELFNTLDTATVKDFKRVIKGFAKAYEGVAPQANKGFRYLNPFLSTSREVFGELTRDTSAFEGLIVDTAKLSGALSERASDISQLTTNASQALGAIASEKQALTDAINELPGFMREANTTFVNLRAALDDLDPLVAASIPVADRLGPFFSEFRAAAADAVPTIRDLDAIVRRPGQANDLIELTRAQVPLAKAGVGSGAPDCSDFEAAADDDFSQGGFGEANCALRNSLSSLAHLRAYTPELLGWFDDFSKSGVTDASGGLGRVLSTFNVFTPSTSGVVDLLGLPLPIEDVVQGIGADSFDVGNNQRCPGANERDPGDGSTPFTDGGTLNCDETQQPVGP
jgi:phospholipid/cholesterol/gamma-HCH transport system substrate-binding protein